MARVRLLFHRQTFHPDREFAMSFETWLAYAAASTVLLVIPGPTIMTVISYALAHGRRANLPLVAAVALGDATALTCSLFGLGALLAVSAFWFTIVKWVGGLYLIFLGLRLFRSGASPVNLGRPAGAGARRRLFLNTYLVTALNPKGIVFFVAFLPQFITPGATIAPQLWALAVTFVILATANAALYAEFAGVARDLLLRPRVQKGFHCVGGTLLTAAGFWALFARRPA